MRKIFAALILVIPVFLFGGSESDFFRACLNGDMEKAIELYNKEGLRLTFSRDKDKNTPLHLACCSKKGGNKKELVDFLISNGVDINALNEHGSTPLFIAVSNGNFEATELLLKAKGIKINQLINGFTVLHIAVMNECIPIVKLLLNHPETNPNFGTADGATPLHFAAMMGLIEEAKLLIDDRRTDINAPQHDHVYSGATPLHFAAMQAQTEIVDYLLKTKQVRINAILDRGDYEGFTPLHFAVLNPDAPNTYSTIKLLLKAGANPKTKCKVGKRAVDLTSVKVIQSLLNNPKKAME
ncbi:MAG: ankyrin repeat domain-containing protein [Simkaniaceae bacterium]|nr:MAG: ankyrin repeat domain-containing protein [Simkaniaceae bacterium]